MIRHPRFLPHFAVAPVPGQGTFLLSETSQIVLQGRIYDLVLPLIDGRRETEEIVSALTGQLSASEVYLAVRRLEAVGCLEEAGDAPTFPRAAWWSAHGQQAAKGRARVSCATVFLRALGGIDDLSALEAAFSDLGAAVVSEESSASVTVVLTDDYLRPELDAINRKFYAARAPWFLAKPSGLVIMCGPLVRPGETPCWECLAQRLRANRETDAFVQRALELEGMPHVPDAGAVASHLVASGLIASEAVRALACGDASTTASQLLSFDLVGRALTTHAVVRRPQCRVCGDVSLLDRSSGGPVRLTGSGAVRSLDGGLRSATPSVTFKRLAHHVSPLTGAVRQLEPSFECPEGLIHTWTADHNLAQTAWNAAVLRRNLRTRAGGKGASAEQARASAVGEALERYSSVYRGEEEPRRRARYADLRGAAIHPSEYLLFSERQFRQREAWNLRESHFNYIPHPFDESVDMDWTPVWSLTREEFRFLPTAVCYFRYPDSPDARYSVSDSNGNAAGNTLEEAVLGGLLELVERDAVAIWWYNRLRVPGVDLDSLADPYLLQLRDYLRRRQRSFWLLDLTFDIGIPVVVALSERQSPPFGSVWFGFGAHLDVRIAARRAATELNQVLSWVLSPDGSEHRPMVDDVDTREWLERASTSTETYLLPDPAFVARRVGDFPQSLDADISQALAQTRRMVEAQGLEVLVLDLTRPDIGLPVVKVFAPGLRHFWARFAPGRLYDVPVALGRRPTPLSEDEMNDFQMFL